MSAIAKPNVKFTNAINNTTMVPVEFVQSIEKIDIPADPNGPANTAESMILFNMLPAYTGDKTIKIKFATSGARDTSFTNYETAMCLSIA